MMTKCVVLLASLIAALSVRAQFIDNFNRNRLVEDRSGMRGWSYFTGDGNASMTFAESGKGYASIFVDATKDKRGIWWALIKRCVSRDIDLARLSNPKCELRIEARIKVGDAPKRVNLSLNTNRTTDFHSHLIEFDIDDTTNWHTISMTTVDFDATPGDTVYGQLALMDWGLKKYRVDVDYFRVDVIDVDTAGPDKGVQVPYHPPIPGILSFSHRLPVMEDGTVDIEYPDMRLSNWFDMDGTDSTRVLSVNGEQFAVLRWDMSRFSGMKAAGSGLLELTTYSLRRSPDHTKDFGMIRVCEIIGGNPAWDGESVTYDSFTRGKPLDKVVNSQMIIDVQVNPIRGGTNLITIPKPVLQRMIEGKTLGIAVKPLGAIDASFYEKSEPDGAVGAALYFNLDTDGSSTVVGHPGKR